MAGAGKIIGCRKFWTKGTALAVPHSTRTDEGFRVCVRTRKSRNIRIDFGYSSTHNRIDFARKCWLSRRLFSPCQLSFAPDTCNCRDKSTASHSVQIEGCVSPYWSSWWQKIPARYQVLLPGCHSAQ